MRCSVQVWFAGSEVQFWRMPREKLDLGEVGSVALREVRVDGELSWTGCAASRCGLHLVRVQSAGLTWVSLVCPADSLMMVIVRGCLWAFFVWLHIVHLFSAYFLCLAYVHFMLQIFILIIPFVLEIHSCSLSICYVHVLRL